jgi:hypothetical protein
MNKTLKIGLVLLGTGIFINIFQRIVGPPILQIPLGDPAKMPLLIMLGICLVGSPLLMLAGGITCLVGAIRKGKQ